MEKRKSELMTENPCSVDSCVSFLCEKSKKKGASFAFLGNHELLKLSSYLGCRHLEIGEIIWEEGDPCDFMAFVVSGRLKIKKETEFEGKQAVVGIYGSGAIAGELCLLDGSPRAVSAEAMDPVDLLTLDRMNFEMLIGREPDLGARLLKGMLLTVSTRLKQSFSRLTTFF
jgi:CRP-like cAMP-binding protein